MYAQTVFMGGLVDLVLVVDVQPIKLGLSRHKTVHWSVHEAD